MHLAPLPSGSDFLCGSIAKVRNMVAYADIFTMATIALVRCLHISCANSSAARAVRLLTPKVAALLCLLLWLLAFLVISPTTFGVATFGRWGYSSTHGRCEIIQCGEADESLSFTGFYFLGAGALPCLIILGSYLTLGIYISAQNRNLRKSSIIKVGVKNLW